MTHTIHQAIAVSQLFSTHIQEALTTHQFRTMNYLNKVEDNPLVCHSQDYCDANEAMYASICTHLGVDEVDVGDEAVQALWNDAWAIAKAAGFDF